MGPRMHDKKGNAQHIAAVQLIEHRLGRKLHQVRTALSVSCQIHQVGTMRQHRPDPRMALRRFPETVYLLFRQRTGLPLALVSGEDLYCSTAHSNTPLKGPVQAARYGHMATKQG